MEVNKIYCGDALEVLKTFPDECIDLTVTSPPYDNLRDYEGYSFDFEGIAQQLFRVTKCGGIVVWVIGDAVVNGSETGTSFQQALFFKEVGFKLHDTMIYKKDSSPFPEQNRYNQCFEYMFVLARGKPKTFNPIKVATIWKSKNNTSTQRGKDGILVPQKYERGFDTKTKSNIWKYSVGHMKSTTDKVAHEHPATFPEKLAQDHIISWSNKGDIVLDPFNGSGTTTKLARLGDRKYVGIDISEKYCKIANDRLKQQKLI